MFSPFEKMTRILRFTYFIEKTDHSFIQKTMEFWQHKTDFMAIQSFLQVERGYCFGIWQAVDDSSRAENGEVRWEVLEKGRIFP